MIVVENIRNCGTFDPVSAEGFADLREREQRAIKVALVGIGIWQRKGVPPQPMRVAISEEKPFDYKSFANVLHKMGVGITDQRVNKEEGCITFQPKPYSVFETKNNKNHSSKNPYFDELKKMVEEGLGGIPGMKDLFKGKSW